MNPALKDPLEFLDIMPGENFKFYHTNMIPSELSKKFCNTLFNKTGDILISCSSQENRSQSSAITYYNLFTRALEIRKLKDNSAKHNFSAHPWIITFPKRLWIYHRRQVSS